MSVLPKAWIFVRELSTRRCDRDGWSGLWWCTSSICCSSHHVHAYCRLITIVSSSLFKTFPCLEGTQYPGSLEVEVSRVMTGTRDSICVIVTNFPWMILRPRLKVRYLPILQNSEWLRWHYEGSPFTIHRKMLLEGRVISVEGLLLNQATVKTWGIHNRTGN